MKTVVSLRRDAAAMVWLYIINAECPSCPLYVRTEIPVMWIKGMQVQHTSDNDVANQCHTDV